MGTSGSQPVAVHSMTIVAPATEQEEKTRAVSVAMMQRLGSEIAANRARRQAERDEMDKKDAVTLLRGFAAPVYVLDTQSDRRRDSYCSDGSCVWLHSSVREHDTYVPSAGYSVWCEN